MQGSSDVQGFAQRDLRRRNHRAEELVPEPEEEAGVEGLLVDGKSVVRDVIVRGVDVRRLRIRPVQLVTAVQIDTCARRD